MSATDPEGLVRTFLDCIRPSANQLPDPFCDEFTTLGASSERPLPARLRGLLARLTEDDRELTRTFVQRRGATTQEFITRRTYNSTAYDARVRELYRQVEADRSNLREHWYGGLSPDDRSAVDDLCLVVAGPVVRPYFPPSLPACLDAPLARLALEHAAIVRRAAAVRQECEESLPNRSLTNRTVVESILRGFAQVEGEATARLIGRWLRELTPEQAAAFDRTGPVGTELHTRSSPISNPPLAPSIPADLQAARDVVVQLVRWLDRTVAEFRGRGPTPTVKLPEGRDRIPGAIAELDRLIADAASKLAPVRGELDAVCQGVVSIAEEVVEFARNFSNSAASLAPESALPTWDVQVWLASAALELARYMNGITHGPQFIYRLTSGIDFEFTKAAMQRTRRKPCQTRVRCDPSDRSVWVDGKRLASGLAPEVYAYFTVLADQYPEPITFPEMQRRSTELEGVNQSRLKDKIPCQLVGIVWRSSNKGHVLRLPE
jgi:hypothetical protein